MQRRDDAGRTQNAFTLVELLIVIGIIALLISILLPALSKARKAANATACLSNLHQMALGMTMYANDNHQALLPYYNSGLWMISISSYVAPGQINPNLPPAKYASLFPIPPSSVAQQLASMNQVPIPKVWFCPEAPLSNATGGSGSAIMPWGPGTYSELYYMAASYGMNGWCYNVAHSDVSNGVNSAIAYSGITNMGVSLQDAPSYFVNDKYAVQSSNTPIFHDSIWVDGWPVDFSTTYIDSPPANAQQLITGVYNSQMCRACIARHGAAVNVAFLDGHVSRVGLADLWGLQWSPKSARLPVPSPGLPHVGG
jgi:prepilin-type N-terminal cleavage/methylation domain-containing protein/prepilin-type processing-associated H-X9-DG protein